MKSTSLMLTSLAIAALSSLLGGCMGDGKAGGGGWMLSVNGTDKATFGFHTQCENGVGKSSLSYHDHGVNVSIKVAQLSLDETTHDYQSDLIPPVSLHRQPPPSARGAAGASGKPPNPPEAIWQAAKPPRSHLRSRQTPQKPSFTLRMQGGRGARALPHPNRTRPALHSDRPSAYTASPAARNAEGHRRPALNQIGTLACSDNPFGVLGNTESR